MQEQETSQQTYQAQDAADVTANQKASWDRSSPAYAKVLVGKGVSKPAARQIVDAVQQYLTDTQDVRTGELLLYQLLLTNHSRNMLCLQAAS